MPSKDNPKFVMLTSAIVILVLVVSLVTLFYYYENEVQKWKGNYVLINQLADSCLENAPEQDCSHMIYPQHRWDYDNGGWICDE